MQPTQQNELFAPFQEISTATATRIAGFLYLIIIVCGIGGDGLVRAPLFGKDAAETVQNLLNAELPFRLSILADVAMVLADVGLGVLLFVLLAPINRTLSLLAMAFRLVQASVLGLNLIHLHSALSLAHNTALGATQRNALVTTSLNAHAAGYDLGLFFFALNCLAVGVLLSRVPSALRWIGWGIITAGLVYLVGSTLRFLAPPLAEMVAPAYVIPLLTELAFCIWLLAKRPLLPQTDAPAATNTPE